MSMQNNKEGGDTLSPSVKMKSSGVEWIGDIPEKWSICRLKNYASVENGKDYKDVQQDDGLIPVMGSGGQFNSCSEVLYDKPSVLLGRKGTVDKPLYVDFPFWTVDTMYYTKMKESTNPKFLYYLCTQIPFGYYRYGSAIPSMTQSDYVDVHFPFLSLDDQKNVSSRLDNICNRVNKCISDITDEISMLQDYKKSVIYEAVTKGLDPNAKMKDSGIEWVGEIPDDWKVISVGNMIIPGKEGIRVGPFGSSLKSEEIADSGNYKVYGQRNLIDDDFNIGSNYISDDKYNSMRNYSIFSGDILLSMMGTIGKCSIVPDNIESGIMDSHLIRVRIKDVYDPNYFKLLYSSSYVQSQLDMLSKGSIMDGLNSTIIKSLVLPIPPKETQTMLFNQTSEKIDKIDRIIKNRQLLIDTISDLRNSIIYEYVTGKKQVSTEVKS